MIKRGYKLIICVVLVSALFIGHGSAFASAEPAIVTRAKAAVAAAMLARSLVLTPVNSALDTLNYSLVDPLNKIEWVETLPEYLERSTIEVIADHAFIDGQYYSQIWLGPEAADKLRLKGLDFTTAYDILTNQSEAITYASGLGYVDGIPVYDTGSSYGLSPLYYLSEGSSSVGNASVLASIDTTSYLPSYRYDVVLTLSNGQTTSAGWTRTPPRQFALQVQNFTKTGNLSATVRAGLQGSSSISPSVSLTVADSDIITRNNFSFDYTSGDFYVEPDPEDGLLLTIPSSYSDPDNPQYNYDIHDLINIYPSVAVPGGHQVEIDPDLNPDFQTDIDLGNNVGDLIRIILSILDLLDHTTVEFAPEPEAPEPGPVDPDPAIPDTPVSDQDGTWLDELLRWIKHAIDVLHQDLADVLDLLDTQLTEIYHEIEQSFDAIREWMENVPDVIKRAHAKGMKDAIGALKKIVLPLLAPIKALMNLWHYVVEWFTSINAPFLWIFGVMSGTSYNLVLPIYASLAGVICIAIYKSFGR